MPGYVAFLRAINLGARRKFPKDDLRSVVEAAGGTDVDTYLNTGNVRLRTSQRSGAAVERRLEAAFLADRGFEVPTIVLSPAELSDVAAYAASLQAPGRHYVELLRDAPGPELVAVIEAGGTEGATAHVSGRAIHLLVEDGYAGAALLRRPVERRLGVTTNRNARVIATLAARWGG